MKPVFRLFVSIFGKAEGRFIMTWKVWYCYLHDGWIKENVINIKADNYDEAISKDRKFDPRYCCAQVVRK